MDAADKTITCGCITVMLLVLGAIGTMVFIGHHFLMKVW